MKEKESLFARARRVGYDNDVDPAALKLSAVGSAVKAVVLCGAAMAALTMSMQNSNALGFTVLFATAMPLGLYGLKNVTETVMKACHAAKPDKYERVSKSDESMANKIGLGGISTLLCASGAAACVATYGAIEAAPNMPAQIGAAIAAAALTITPISVGMIVAFNHAKDNLYLVRAK